MAGGQIVLQGLGAHQQHKPGFVPVGLGGLEEAVQALPAVFLPQAPVQKHQGLSVVVTELAGIALGVVDLDAVQDFVVGPVPKVDGFLGVVVGVVEGVSGFGVVSSCFSTFMLITSLTVILESVSPSIIYPLNVIS